MINKMTKQVTRSVVGVMESMFNFIVYEENTLGSVLTDLPDLLKNEHLRACKITFHGAYSGIIYLLVPIGVLAKMSANFMDQEAADLTEDITDGTLREALNMVAGDALTNMDEKSFTGLGIPEVIDPSSVPLVEDVAVLYSDQDLILSYVQMEA